jgi:hypothetical protein
MNMLNRSALMRSMTLALVAAAMPAAHAQDALKDIEVSGFLDFYYSYGTNRPATGDTLLFRQFDLRHNGGSLANAQINILKKAKPNGVGFTLNLTAGKNADIINTLEPGGQDRYKLLHQAYGTYLSDTGFNVDIGKFLTWIGYEGAASADNDNYSRSFLFTFGEPLYHTGVRFGFTPKDSALTYGLYLTNGWNEVEDSNGGKTFGASVAGTFGKTFVSLNGLSGREGSEAVSGIGFPTLGQREVTMGDLVVTHQLTDKLKLALNADIAKAKGKGAASDGDWSGLAAYAKYQATDKVSLGARWETFSDEDGIRTGFDAHLNSLTFNVDYAPVADFLVRLEFRADRANRKVFLADGGNKTKQDTISLSAVFKF